MKRFAIYSSAFIFAAAMALPGGAFAQSSGTGSSMNGSAYGNSATDNSSNNASRTGIGGAPDQGAGNGQSMKSGASATGNSSGSGTSEWTTRKGDPVTGEANPGPAAGSQSETTSGSR